MATRPASPTIPSPVACPPWRDTSAKQKEKADSLERHSRKCLICRHPDRDAIEEEFLHWHRVVWIAREYQIPDHRTIYRHARAVGLIQARRENFHSALDNIVEQSDGINASADAVLRAIRAYSCLDETGRWIDLPAAAGPPKEVHFTYTMNHAAAGGPMPTQPADENEAAETEPAAESAEPNNSPADPDWDYDETKDPSSPKYIEQGPPPLIGPPVIRIGPKPLKTKDRQLA